MMRVAPFSVVVVLFGILLFVLCVVAHSPWFLMGLAGINPEQSYVTIGVMRSDDVIAKRLTEYVLPYPDVDFSKRSYVYSEGVEGGIRIAGFEVWGRDQFVKDMETVGFNVSTLGPVVYGSSTESPRLNLLSLGEGFSSLLLYKGRSNLPLLPNVIVSAKEGSRAFVNSDVAGIAARDGKDSIVVTAQKSTRSFLDIVPSHIPEAFLSAYMDLPVAISVEANTLQEAPTESLVLLNSYLNKGLGLTHTSPSLVEMALSGGRFAVLGDDRDVLLFTTELGGQQKALMRQAIEGEAAYDYPAKQAFALPDGTIGYEYVPDGEKVSFDRAVSQDGCDRIKVHDRHIWFCEHADGSVIVTSSQEMANIARQLVVLNTNLIQITANASDSIGLESLGLAAITTTFDSGAFASHAVYKLQ